MATRSAAPDLAVDELKRRARRRLVGAIVLALAAAVILPLLLESDPKPLGDEVIDPHSADRQRQVRQSARPGQGLGKAAASRHVPSPRPSCQSRRAGDHAAKSIAGAAAASSGDPARRRARRPRSSRTPSAPGGSSCSTCELRRRPARADAPLGKGGLPAAAPPAPASDIAQRARIAYRLRPSPTPRRPAILRCQAQARRLRDVHRSRPTAQGDVQRVRVGPFATRGDADAGSGQTEAAGYDRAMVAPKHEVTAFDFVVIGVVVVVNVVRIRSRVHARGGVAARGWVVALVLAIQLCDTARRDAARFRRFPDGALRRGVRGDRHRRRSWSVRCSAGCCTGWCARSASGFSIGCWAACRRGTWRANRCHRCTRRGADRPAAAGLVAKCVACAAVGGGSDEPASRGCRRGRSRLDYGKAGRPNPGRRQAQEPRTMCGIVGAVTHTPVNQLLYDGLLLLQHRGQDAAGIVTSEGRYSTCTRRRAMCATCSAPATCAS